ncbi:MAG TPA: hypothetical protein VLL52_23795 [Anaerolineae bacterium]|nr:hypothetical protein [Anaerolineae bacterium]
MLNAWPQLDILPLSLPVDGAINMSLEDGIPVFRASLFVQQRIELLLHKQKSMGLTKEEVEELDLYEQVDDYLSYLNRIIRN